MFVVLCALSNTTILTVVQSTVTSLLHLLTGYVTTISDILTLNA